MEGIQFLVNDKGHRTAVVIDLQQHGEVWEDFSDALIAQERADEPDESIESVESSLRQQGKLAG